MAEERTIRTEVIRVRRHRLDNGSCLKLGRSIEKEGLRRPVTLWSGGKHDCTIISGERRLFAHMLIQKETIQAVFVDTIEDAAKRMIGDNDDAQLEVGSGGPGLAKRMTYSEMCRLWATLRLMDAPAAAMRHHAALERGNDLRKKTQAGLRPPGRASNRTEDYMLAVCAEPFGISSATARRIERIYNVANGVVDAPEEKAEMARAILADLNARKVSVWEAYTQLTGSQRVYQPRQKEPAAKPSISAKQQLAAWNRGIPQMEGLTEGFVALGALSPDLTWEQVGPVHARLSAIRRDLEKMIWKMKEINKK